MSFLRKWISFYSFLSIGLSNYALGYGAGNGGQPIASEFSSSALEAVGFVQGHRALCSLDAIYAPLCEVNLSQVRGAIQSVTLEVLPGITRIDPTDGSAIEYAALNYPKEKRIEISQKEWVKPAQCGLKKLTLAFHEYLGILGVEQNNYPVSSILRMWLLSHGDESLFLGCENEAPQSSRCKENHLYLTGYFKQACDDIDVGSQSGRNSYLSCLASRITEWKVSTDPACLGQGAIDACMNAALPKIGPIAYVYCSGLKPRRAGL